MGTDRGGQGGVVINTGSTVSINPYVSVPIYSATKAAIVSFTRAFGVRDLSLYLDPVLLIVTVASE